MSSELQVLKNPLLQQNNFQEQKSITFLSMFMYSNASEKAYMIVGVISAALAGITFPFFLIFFGAVTDLLTIRQNAVEKGFSIFIKFVIIGSLYWIFTFVSLYCWGFAGSTQAIKLKSLYYRTLLEQQIAWYDSIDVGRLAPKIAKNISTIENAIGEKVAILISAAFTSSFGVIYSLFKCWEFSLFLIGFLPITIYVGYLLIRSYGLSAKINNASYQQASGIAQQAFSAIKTIKCLVGEEFELTRFREALDKGQKKSLKYIFYVACCMAAFIFVQFLVYGYGLWMGKNVMLWNSSYSATVIVGTYFAVISGGTAFGQISPVLKVMAQGKVAFSQFRRLTLRKKTLDQSKGTEKVGRIKTIEFKQVSFKYSKLNESQQNISDTSSLTINKLNLKILRNKINAFVGQSGCGKSTLVQLLLRYYDCQDGSILINGKNIKNINIKKFRRTIGFVGQQPVLFAMSIEDNLKLANPKLSQTEIIQALKKANAWQFVQKMEKGIKSYVGTGGTQLSGGQKQRIAIARAICKNPQILILDQATSALDRKNERQIQMTLQNLQESGITTIVIAHRLSTIKNADKIFVFNRGLLVQSGSHSQLLKINKLYSQLVHTQILAEKQTINEEKDRINESLVQFEQQKDEIEISKHKRQDEAILKQQTDKFDSDLKRKQQQKKQKQGQVYRKLFEYSRSHILFLILGILGALINGTALPFYNVAFGNLLTLMNNPHQNQQDIDKYCLLFIIIAVVASVSAFCHNFCFGIVGDKLVYNLRLKIFQKLLKLPVSYYDKKQNTPGSISTKLATQTYQIHNLITGLMAVIGLNLTTISITLILAFFHCWQISLLTLALTPFLVIVSSITIKITKTLTTKSKKAEEFIGSLISDTVNNIKTVKSFGKPKHFIKKFEQNLQHLNKIAFERSIKISFFQGMRRSLIIIFEGIIFWVVGQLYQNGIINDKASIFISIFALIYASSQVGQNSQHMPDITRAKQAGVTLFDLIQTKDELQISIQEGGLINQQLNGNILFKNVSFKYPERDQMILQNFSLAINSSQKIGLVGSSGSGKSTIIQLLMRLYPINKGQIFLNNRNIKQFNLYELRRQIGVVYQEPTVFLGTIEQNIKYNVEADADQVKRAIEISCCQKFINQWDEGLDKQVGQKGSQISGGQKQRIAIARCLIRQPKIILFDQSTSALDTDTQKRVFQNLRPILKEMTSISIAHRLSTIEDADKIILMKDGKIIEEGTYINLIELRGQFFKLSVGK